MFIQCQTCELCTSCTLCFLLLELNQVLLTFCHGVLYISIPLLWIFSEIWLHQLALGFDTPWHGIAWLSWKIFNLPFTVLVHLFICLTHSEFSTYTGSCGQYAKLKGATSPLTPWGWDKGWHGCMWYIKFLIGVYNLKDKVTYLYWSFQDNVDLQQKRKY